MKKRLLYLSFIFSLLSFSLLAVWLYLYFTPVVSGKNGVVYYLRPGISKKALVNELSQQHLIRWPLLFTLYLHTQTTTFKAGEYRFPQGSSIISIWKQITEGMGLVYHPFTIVPGWTFRDIRRELAKNQDLHPLIAKLDDKQVMSFLGHPELAPEGEFFPETYYYTKGIPDLVILKRAFDLMQLKLNEAWEKRSPGLPYQNIYAALIAASLVEKEAYWDTERPIIAGVLINRLRKGMLLQFDPTVIYGLGLRYDGKIYKQNLLDNNAYNTYIYKGLPPTPIAMPSLISIEAALHPSQHAYLYFVAKGNGAHQFSIDLETHHQAVIHNQQINVKLHQADFFNGERINYYLRRQLGWI
jgi:UPF0755 protein